MGILVPHATPFGANRPHVVGCAAELVRYVMAETMAETMTEESAGEDGGCRVQKVRADHPSCCDLKPENRQN